MKIPVSIVTDLDIREYERETKGNIYRYLKQDIKDYSTKLTVKGKEILDAESETVKPFISKIWTFEWCLLKSVALNGVFKDILKNIHKGIFSNCTTEEEWEIGLATILLSKSIEKTEIAYQLSVKIESLSELKIDECDTIYYLIDAIKHACNDRN
jgi:putative ATP-dependent endonuclease of OLD family